MYKLIQHLIAFKYACKSNHWQANSYSSHLLFDELAENIDEWVDKIAECYFMGEDKADVFKEDILNQELFDINLVVMCNDIIEHLESLQSSEDSNEGMNSILSDIEAGFLNKVAIAKLG